MENPFKDYKLSSSYGWRRRNGSSKFHAGIDLIKQHKAPIYAFTDGVVLFSGMGKPGTGLNNYGNVVVMKDKNGRGHLYAHLDRTAVKAGDTIKKGQLIGYQGDTGNATGSHLHYEIRKKTSPSFGWESDRVNSTIEPTYYLQQYDATEPDPQLTYTVKAGDTLYSIAQKYSTTVSKLQEANNIANPNLIKVGQVIIIPSSKNPVYYTVKSGDTLTKIAKTFDTTVDQLVKMNGIKNRNLISIGQRLRVK